MTPFTIKIDNVTGLISAVAYEFWDLSILKEFETKVAAAQEAVRRSKSHPLLMIDARCHGVQSKEVVQGLQAFANSNKGRATKTAVIVESALYRLQANRIRSVEHHAIFCDEHEARDWLFAD